VPDWLGVWINRNFLEGRWYQRLLSLIAGKLCFTSRMLLVQCHNSIRIGQHQAARLPRSQSTTSLTCPELACQASGAPRLSILLHPLRVYVCSSPPWGADTLAGVSNGAPGAWCTEEASEGNDCLHLGEPSEKRGQHARLYWWTAASDGGLWATKKQERAFLKHTQMQWCWKAKKRGSKSLVLTAQAYMKGRSKEPAASKPAFLR